MEYLFLYASLRIKRNSYAFVAADDFDDRVSQVGGRRLDEASNGAVWIAPTPVRFFENFKL